MSPAQAQGYRCPTCGRLSAHPEDAKHLFCVVCGFEQPVQTPPDIAAQILAVERHLRMLRRQYPRLVAAGQLGEAQAQAELAVMGAVLDTLHSVQDR